MYIVAGVLSAFGGVVGKDGLFAHTDGGRRFGDYERCVHLRRRCHP